MLKPTLFNKKARQIVEILELPYWKEKRFSVLLTPTIFTRNASQIKELFELPYWDDPKYESLLCSSIYMKSATQIKEIIEFCNNNGLETLSNNRKVVYQFNNEEFIKKVNYLKSKGEKIIEDDKINPLFERSKNK